MKGEVIGGDEGRDFDAMVRTAVAVFHALEEEGSPLHEFQSIGQILVRGYLTPEEDERLRVRYSAYWVRRGALLQVLAAMESRAGRTGVRWQREAPAFLLGLTVGLILVRSTRGWIELAEACRPIRKALDLSDGARGVHRKSFASQYRATTRLSRLGLLRMARDHYLSHQEAFREEAIPAGMEDLLEVLDSECGRPLVALGLGAVWERWRYRWFSFRRRHHSAWKLGEFTLFRWSGTAIADWRQPGIRPSGPKRISAALRTEVLKGVRPGDVFVTRHDDALSNLFLPGFWPHAALYYGEEGAEFLEAKKDGVRFRKAEETLQVDSLVVLRPPLEFEEMQVALARARAHAGKSYDFVFDFRRSDRLACTEVVYRGFDGIGGLHFELVETGGRLCLPAEELIQQALQQGFRVIVSCGIDGGGCLRGQAAELALHRSRCGL
ncbi:hypothetical protein HNR46_003151 [Haloferula luteola]|uniref:Permuted papain-like amidase enzyme, YaeF/YiiX, C92 family n=1 Tax=Haloferula luteola TaxID=595692 RepID=A0A840V4J2_9BACT|nr:YiiX/YebB-like N1pC/P60 family cysteine hydrolase [Haloferula luteola]MBB5352902.1 hypothetical protein [Haloferula luteola]